MISILIAAMVGMVVALIGTPVAIRSFTKWGWGQRIREDGPQTHFEKMGTPTMGGIVILLGFVLSYLATRVTVGRFTAAGVSLVLAAIGFGVVGFLDDFIKVRHRRSLGLNKTQKFIGTAIAATIFSFIVWQFSERTGISTNVSFIRVTGINLGILFFIWAFFILTGSSHAVNITDGLDGLAGGSSILVLAAYTFIAFWQFRHNCQLLSNAPSCYPVNGPSFQDTAIVAAGMMGSVTGFLWWNAAPARIFMGDTGALALGGLFGALAITTNTQLLLVILCGLFVVETTSVILQIISFRGFGRRIFLMSPIHHHFELSGWPEFTVIVRFWIIAGLCVAVGLGLFYADFIARGGLG